jgi:biotin carboxylase
LVASKLGYQTRGFADAVRRLGAEVVFGTDRCRQLDDPWGDAAIPLDFEYPEEAAKAVAQLAGEKPIDAVLALGDRQILAAAHVARLLRLGGNSVEAAQNCRTKLRQREVLAAAGLPVPDFFSFRVDEELAGVAERVRFPCVVKPLGLAASQGVIRADNQGEFRDAVARIRRLVESPPIQAGGSAPLDQLLVERYLPGREVAVEGLLTAGRLRVLAIFDKPDALEGPFFEETIYVTPSRLPRRVQAAIGDCIDRSVCALGLSYGPVHAEFRIGRDGPSVLEIHPRPIGGLCARSLRFGPGAAGLEELLVRHALGLPGADWDREREASGVMMIPVPRSGILEGVEGVDKGRAVPGVAEIAITARAHDPVVAWPEGSSYLGFIFARAGRPERVEQALRAAYRELRFAFAPELPVAHPLATSH